MSVNRKKSNSFRKCKAILVVFILVSLCSAIAIVISNKNSSVLANKKVAHNKVKRQGKQSIMDKRESKLPPEESGEVAGSVTSGEYMPWLEKHQDGEKVAYLTFDDGPSKNTPEILSILKQYNAHATFFLIGKNVERFPEYVKDEIAAGDAVGNHTYSHTLSYKEGPQAFVEDLNKCREILKSIIGDKFDSKLIRFPGGSWDSRWMNLRPFRDAASKAGYHFVNWNDLSGDAEHPLVPKDTLVARVKKETGNKKVVVILMHDAAAKTTSVQALPEIIQYLQENGYTFKTLR